MEWDVIWDSTMVMRMLSLMVYVIDFMNIRMCVYCGGMDICLRAHGKVKEKVFLKVILERKVLEKLWQRGSYLSELLKVYHSDDIQSSTSNWKGCKL